jgi:predicted nuclease with TOPRIM domain
MKTILFLPILFCAIAFPAFAELTPQDLDKIRLIVKDEVKAELSPAKQELKAEITAVKQELQSDITASHTKIEALATRLQSVEHSVAWIRGKLDSLDKHINWLMALIVVAVVISQMIIAWPSREDRAQVKQIKELAREIEILKQQRIVSP